MDLSAVIERNAAFHPDKAAIRFGSQNLSYAALAQRIGATARGLKSVLGIGRGDRVAIFALNEPDYLVLLYACARLGAMLVPLNWRLAVPELAYILADSEAKAVFLGAGLADAAAPLRTAVPEARLVGLGFEPENGFSFEAVLGSAGGDGRYPRIDLSCPLLVVYTSGTTGRPKGAVLRQEALVWNAFNSQHMHDLGGQDHVLTLLPLFHVGGLNIQTTPALQHGATVTLHARFHAEAALDAIERDRPSLTVLVPSTMQALIGLPRWPDADLSGLRAVTTGSTVVPQPLIDAFTSRGVPVLQVYGSTETCPIAVYTRLGGDLSRPGSTGLPGLFTQARVVDEGGAEVAPGIPGEVVVRGPNVFSGYWGDAGATAEALRDGWYRTGDIATRDRDGYFTVRDRRKNVIISGGENIYPAEVERVLHEHPAVSEAAVVGRPDERWQEVPVAFIVRRGGAELVPDELKAHSEAHLARFKCPREFILVEALPRNAMGKVQHFLLRERLRSGLVAGQPDRSDIEWHRTGEEMR